MKQDTAQELTPKNLYRLISGRLPHDEVFLTFADKPVRGMTLVSFWRELLENVISDETMSTLFPDDGRHPRIQSSLMNRTGTNPTPRLLRVDLGARLSPRTLLVLVSNCSEILIKLTYDSNRFHSALDLFEDRCAREDCFLSNATYRYLKLLRADYALVFDGRHSPILFRDSLRLAWNALFALFGPMMNGEELRQLMADREAAPAALWEQLCQDQSLNSRIHSAVRIHSLLAGSPLPEEEYIPLLLTPADVLRAVRERKKVLLTGPGGSGKTQLACQVFALAGQQSVYHMIVALTAGESLTESFAALFPDRVAKRAEDPLENIRKLLDDPTVLLIIDGLENVSAADGAAESFRGLSCDLLVTGRMPSLEGFMAIPVPRMSEDAAVRLLTLAGRGFFSPADQPALRSLSLRLGGHPLALRLIGSLCQTYYMKPAEMQAYLSAKGFQGLSLGQGREQQELQAMLGALLVRVPLRAEETQMMRLLSMLPERTWRAQDLKPYAADIEKAGVSCFTALERLSAMGLLQREPSGYGLHPVISSVFRVPAISAEEFPLLWAGLRRDYSGPVSKELQERFPETLRMIQTTSAPTRDALDVLDRLCATAMTRSRWQAQPWMLEKYRAWLDLLPHTDADEIDLLACRMLWCTVLPWQDRLDPLAEELSHYSAQDMLSSVHYILLVNMMEIGGPFIRRELVVSLLEKLRPPKEPVLRMINYLNFLGGTQRAVLREPESALETLREARELIPQAVEADSAEEATNCTRTAYTLADLKRYEEALPLMVRVLEILKKRGYAEDSPTFSASRNALSYFRGQCGDRVSARDALKKQLDQWEESGLPPDYNYLSLLLNYAITLDGLYQLEEAEETARRLVKLCRQMAVAGQENLPRGLELLGEVLMKQSHPGEALGYFMEADALFRKAYPASASNVVNCRKRMAEAMIAVGQTEEGRRILSEM